jgi:hypothetical protein
MEIIIGLLLIPVIAVAAFLVWSATDAGRKRTGRGSAAQDRRAVDAAGRRGALTNDTAAPPVD